MARSKRRVSRAAEEATTPQPEQQQPEQQQPEQQQRRTVDWHEHLLAGATEAEGLWLMQDGGQDEYDPQVRGCKRLCA
jgi:hypothetical protein